MNRRISSVFGQCRKQLKQMKLNLCILTLVGLVAVTSAAVAQTNSPAGEAPAAVAAPATPAEAPAPVAATPAPAAQPGASIPLIVMDDVPLTDAIRNLARQANLNYMLDPKIGYGQSGTDGKIMPQPSVSIRWENITAEQALNALLNNYTLQLVEDPKSKIARITTKDPAALEPLTTKIFQLKWASPSNLVVVVQSSLVDKRSRVMPDYRSSQLIVVATEKELVEVDALVSSLDTKTKQVLIEARLLETIINPKTMKGIDWSGTLKAQNVTFGNGVLSGNTLQNSSQNNNQNASLNANRNSSSSSSGNSSQNSSANSDSSRTTTSPGTPVTTTTTLPGGRTVTTTTIPASDSTSADTSSSSGSSGSGSSTLSGSGFSMLASAGASAVGGSGISTLLNSVIGNGGLSLDTMKGLNPYTMFLNADGVKATLSFLNTYSDTKVISSPRTVTLDNETASIEVGTMWPIVNTTAGTANTTGGSSISYSNLTVLLRVTPRISANNFVKLQVLPRVIRLGEPVVSVVGGVANRVDSFNTREILTSVLIPSGNTLVMGGLIQDEIHTGNIKVPLLGDLPILGLLFRQDTKDRTKSNLIVFLTPTIVEDEDYQPTKSNFLRSKVPVKDSIEGDWSAWDSGKPVNWSKKMVAPKEPSTANN
jgi:type II secretory pathway component GspD/PulD (secretin)